MSDREHAHRVFGEPHMETDMDLMTERAITSMVERGTMTLEEAVVKRADLRQAVDAAGERAERRPASDSAPVDGEE